MYESYWKCSRKPFAHNNDPAGFYRSKTHQAALLRLKYGIDNFDGPALIMGMSGTGKSSLVRVFAAEHSTLRPFVHVMFPALQCDELLRLIAGELSLLPMSAKSGSETALREIQRSLRQFTAKNQHPLICFDDAHLLSDDALQFVIQPLLNMVESDSMIRLAILLVGQPVLSSRLRKLGELGERLAVTTPILGFTAAETADYVRTCLNNSGAKSSIFSTTALQKLYEVTGGNPRRLNRLCDMALLVGYAEQLSEITDEQIAAVSSELTPAAA